MASGVPVNEQTGFDDDESAQLFQSIGGGRGLTDDINRMTCGLSVTSTGQQQYLNPKTQIQNRQAFLQTKSKQEFQFMELKQKYWKLLNKLVPKNVAGQVKNLFKSDHKNYLFRSQAVQSKEQQNSIYGELKSTFLPYHQIQQQMTPKQAEHQKKLQKLLVQMLQELSSISQFHQKLYYVIADKSGLQFKYGNNQGQQSNNQANNDNMLSGNKRKAELLNDLDNYQVKKILVLTNQQEFKEICNQEAQQIEEKQQISPSPIQETNNQTCQPRKSLLSYCEEQFQMKIQPTKPVLDYNHLL